MIPKLLYIGIPTTTVQPVVQPLEGQRAVITSIRLSAYDNKAGTFEIHHVRNGETVTASANSLAFNVPMNAKTAMEFLTHPIVVGEGEGLWISGEAICFAVYGIVL